MPSAPATHALMRQSTSTLLYLMVEYAYLTRQTTALARTLHIRYPKLQAIHRAGCTTHIAIDPRDFSLCPA